MTPIADLEAKKIPFADFRTKNRTLTCHTSISLAIWKCTSRKAAKFYCLRPCCENPGPKSIPQCYGAALNSNDSHITREVNSQNVFTCCSHVICGSEIDQYNYPGIIIAGFTQ